MDDANSSLLIPCWDKLRVIESQLLAISIYISSDDTILCTGELSDKLVFVLIKDCVDMFFIILS